MDADAREITVRGVRFWVGPETRAPSTRLRRAGGEAGPDDVVAEFGRVGRDGKPMSGGGSIRFDTVRRRAIVEFERRRATIDGGSAAEALERFLSAHLVPGKIILFP